MGLYHGHPLAALHLSDDVVHKASSHRYGNANGHDNSAHVDAEPTHEPSRHRVKGELHAPVSLTTVELPH